MKKILSKSKALTTIIITILTLSIVIAAIPFAKAATGSVTMTPMTMVTGVNTIATVSGGTFTTGAPLYYEFSTSNTWSGTGTYWFTLPAGTTTLPTGTTVTLTPSAAGIYYFLVSDSASGSSGVITPGAVTVVSTGPTITSLSPTTGHVGDTPITITATFPTTGHALTLYVDYVNSTTTAALSPSTSTAGTNPYTFTVPHLGGGAHKLFLYDSTSSVSAAYSGSNYVPFTVTSKITITSPTSLAVGATTTITLNGTGFQVGDTFAASSSTAPLTNILVGGVTTYHSAITAIPASGNLNSVGLILSSGLSATGPYNIVFTYDQAGVTPETFTNAIYVSKPTESNLGIALSTTSGTVGSSLTVTYWNLPASATTITMDGTTFTGTTPDANGFGSYPLSAGVPAMPAGTYLIIVSASNQYVSAPFTVTSKITIKGGAVSMSGLYTPSGETITVSGTGLAPLATYSVTDSGSGTAKAITVVTGSLTTDATGSFTITYSTSISVATGTSVTVSVTGLGISATSVSYLAAGAVTLSLPSSAQPGVAVTGLSFTGLIPAGSTTYSGVASTYNLYYNPIAGAAPGTLITLSYTNLAGGTSTTPAAGWDTSYPSLTFGVAPATTFTVGMAGIYSINIVRMDTVPTATLASQAFTVSVPALTTGTINMYKLTAGVLTLVTTGTVGTSVTLYATSFGASEGGVTAYMMTSTGKQTLGSLSIDANGAAKLPFTVPATPAGTYDIFVTRTTTGAAAVTSVTLAVTAQFSFTATFVAGTTASGAPGSTFNVYGRGLVANTAYVVTWGGTQMSGSVFTTDNTGAGSVTGLIVPTTATATGYTVAIATAAAPGTTVVSGTYTVTTAATFTPDPSAFPSQLVTFQWNVGTGLTAPVYVTVLLNGTAYTTAPASYVSGILYGSFNMPNAAAAGTVYSVTLSYTDSAVATVNIYASTADSFTGTGSAKNFTLSVLSTAYLANSELVTVAGVVQTRSTNYTVSTSGTHPVIAFTTAPASGAKIGVSYSYIATTTTKPNPATSAMSSGQAVTITLVSGSGALIMSISISNADVTRIANAVNSTVYGPIATIVTTTGSTITMALSQLNAKIVAINGTVATILTNQGKMTASLNTINATLVDIKDRVIVINTTLGEVRTLMKTLNLTAINAVIKSLNQTIATISSDIGTVKVSLDDIGLKVVAINGSATTILTDLSTLKGATATVQTDLGTISGTITSINGSVATIKTDVGTVKTDVSGIVEKGITVDLTPVWIAVVFSLLAFIAAIAAVVMLLRKLA